MVSGNKPDAQPQPGGPRAKTRLPCWYCSWDINTHKLHQDNVVTSLRCLVHDVHAGTPPPPPHSPSNNQLLCSKEQNITFLWVMQFQLFVSLNPDLLLCSTLYLSLPQPRFGGLGDILSRGFVSQCESVFWESGALLDLKSLKMQILIKL